MDTSPKCAAREDAQRPLARALRLPPVTKHTVALGESQTISVPDSSDEMNPRGTPKFRPAGCIAAVHVGATVEMSGGCGQPVGMMVRSAFSLVEVMAVVAIAGVLASLAVGLGSNFVKQNRAREEKEEFRTLLIQSRNHARRSAACVRVTRVSASEMTAAILTGVAGCPLAPFAVAPSPAQVVSKSANTVSQFDTASVLTSTLTFFPDGSTRTAGPVLLRFIRFDGVTSGLRVWPGAGIVTEEG